MEGNPPAQLRTRVRKLRQQEFQNLHYHIRSLLLTYPPGYGAFYKSTGSVPLLVWKSDTIYRHLDDLCISVNIYPRWNRYSGSIRDQMRHLLCWDYVGTDLMSIESAQSGWESRYIPLCTWQLCRQCRPDLLSIRMDSDGLHHCYPYSVRGALEFIKTHGVHPECRSLFCCDVHHPSAPIANRGMIRIVNRIPSLAEAIYHLISHPIGADLICYSHLFSSGNNIYYGPRTSNVEFIGYHAVIIVSVMMYLGELVAKCKMSNGTRVADLGYAYVSLRTMYLVTGTNARVGYVRPTYEPQHLLSNFIYINMNTPGASSSTAI